MCRSIKQLRNPDQPPTDAEIEAAALQFVRKVSGYRVPFRDKSTRLRNRRGGHRSHDTPFTGQPGGAGLTLFLFSQPKQPERKNCATAGA